MLLKARKGFYGNEGLVRRNQLLDVADYRAADLQRRGLVAPVLLEGGGPGGAGNPTSRPPVQNPAKPGKPAGGTPRPRPQGRTEAEPATPTGGQTGVARPRSSSPPGPAPQPSTSAWPVDGLGSS